MEKTRDLGGEGVPGRVEACFWIPSEENPNSGQQWRIRGRSIVIPREPSKDTKQWLLSRLQNNDSSEGKEFDIAVEETAQFGNVSPNIQGSFKQPPPNTPRALGPQGPGLGLKQKTDGLNDKIARENFRVAVIEADRVEWVDLTKPQKTVWVRVGSEMEKDEGLEKFGEVNGDWREVDMWP